MTDDNDWLEGELEDNKRRYNPWYGGFRVGVLFGIAAGLGLVYLLHCLK